MKKNIYFGLLLILGFIAFVSLPSCKTSLEVREKSGSVLWSENCSRCHYSPDPEDYNDAQWEVIVLHMRVRSSLTEEEAEKITKFLQDSN
ncbi:MAG: cytochrome c [Bacteroidia bacterium]|nr:cytochrome c [Bacteroidia bacterium]MCF8425844.1 cytochrome c [Bacteroidia bacterium]MCF8447420.1 cytochrome c [Bacteroidia bacterium]